MPRNYVTKRGAWYQYRRRVPAHVANFDERKEVLISLKTQSHSEAVIKAAIYNDQIENFWKALIQSGESTNIQEKYKAAVHLAKAHGFAYKSTAQIAASTLNEIVERLETDVKTEQEERALLGEIDLPHILLSESIELFWPLVVDRLVNKSEHDIRKWKNPRQAAMLNFIEVVGDKPIHKVTRSEVLAFRHWWSEKIRTGHSADTANKQIRFVKDIIKTVAINNELSLDIEPLFVDTKFQYKVKSRPPFEARYVQDTLLPGLSELNERDKMVLYVMADTGAREREIFGLMPEDIRLDTEIPFIWIRPREGYELKTATSQRQIPLVGTALEAFRQCPQGFHHAGNPDTFSNIINKYLRDKKLRPTPRHSAYSLRHTFKDRLRDAEAPEEMIDELMGHAKVRPHYGRGHKLENKYKWLSEIAYSVPDTLK